MLTCIHWPAAVSEWLPDMHIQLDTHTLRSSTSTCICQLSFCFFVSWFFQFSTWKRWFLKVWERMVINIGSELLNTVAWMHQLFQKSIILKFWIYILHALSGTVLTHYKQITQYLWKAVTMQIIQCLEYKLIATACTHLEFTEQILCCLWCRHRWWKIDGIRGQDQVFIKYKFCIHICVGINFDKY